MKRKAHNKIEFSPEQHEFLRRNYQSMTSQQMAIALGFKNTRVRIERYALGLYKQELEYWTPEMFEHLKANYQTKGDTEIAREFEALFPRVKDWTKKHIEKKRCQNGLVRTKQQIENIFNRNKEQGAWAECGSKMWDKIGRRPIGDIQVWHMTSGYAIRVIKTENGYVKLSHKVYTDAGNVLKKRHNLIHIDGITLNCELDNLKLVTDQELNQLNRQKYLSLPNEIQELIKINNKITQKIKQHEQH